MRDEAQAVQGGQPSPHPVYGAERGLGLNLAAIRARLESNPCPECDPEAPDPRDDIRALLAEVGRLEGLLAHNADVALRYQAEVTALRARVAEVEGESLARKEPGMATPPLRPDAALTPDEVG